MTLPICLRYLDDTIRAIDENLRRHKAKNEGGRRQKLIDALNAERAVLVEIKERLL